MPLTFAEIRPGMSVSATSTLRPEDVKKGVVKFKVQQPFTPGAPVEDWVGIEIPGIDPIQNFSLKYWTLEASGAAGAGSAAAGGGGSAGTFGGARRRRSARRADRTSQFKRRQRYTKKK